MYSSFIGSLVATAAATGFALGRKLKGDAKEREIERHRIQVEMVTIKPLVGIAEERLLSEYCMQRLSAGLATSIVRDVVVSSVGQARWNQISADEGLIREVVKYSTDRARSLSEMREPERIKRLNMVKDRIFSRKDMRDFFGKVYSSHAEPERKARIFSAFCEVVSRSSGIDLKEVIQATESDLIFKTQLIAILCHEAKNSTQEASLVRRISQADSLTGIEFEVLCRDILIHSGWRVKETKKTGDQGVDLIALSGSEKICLQCKRQSSPVGNGAVQQVHAGRAFYKCDQAYVVSNMGYTASARELADAVGVKLLSASELLHIKKP